MASTPAFVPVRVKIATSKCAIKIPTCPTSKRDFLPNDLTANILTKDESRLTTPTAYVPVRALNPLVLSPRMFFKIVFEYARITLIPVNSWKTIYITLIQLALVYLSSEQKASPYVTLVDYFWIVEAINPDISSAIY